MAHALFIQVDGKLPNLALMRIGHWHLSRGDTVEYTRNTGQRDVFDPPVDHTYISSIFTSSQAELMRAMYHYPKAIVGGSATPFKTTVEDVVGGDYEAVDYSGYPDFTASIGYTQRGCRMSGKNSPCRKFCIVPEKEGFPVAVNAIEAIWRGEPYPKHLHLLDNDFFGNPQWRERIAEIRDGNFKVSFSQGINTRLINKEAAEALASVKYRDDGFSEKRLYTAWDNIGNERIFFRGVQILEDAGVPSKHLMAYMLIGCDPEETWERIWYRFTRMVEKEILPYPMVFRERTDLKCFQRYVIYGFYRWVPWDRYKRGTKSMESVEGWRPFADRLAVALPKLQKVAA